MFWFTLSSISLVFVQISNAYLIPENLRPRSATADTHPADLLRRSPLTDCLSSKGVTILVPGNPTFPTASQSFNRRFAYTPLVIAYPASQAQIQETIRCANIANVKVQPRSGGHSYGAFGVGGQNGSLVVDLERFQGFRMVGTTAYAGAGLRLGALATRLWAAGRALPHGTCAGVGVGGHSLHGGFGPASRNWGLTVDSIIELRGVLADGSTFACSATSNPDLFWALRGAGASFAIVHEFLFRTFPAPARVVHWSFSLTFDTANRAADVFAAFQAFGKTVPKEMWLRVYVERTFMSIAGSWFGSRAQFDAILAPFETTIRTIYGRDPGKNVLEQDWPTTLERYNGGPLNVFAKFDTFYAKSLEIPENSPLTLNTIRSLFNYVFNAGRSSPNPWFFIANLYGGPGSAINSVPLSANSYGWRDTHINIQFYGFTPGSIPPFQPQIITLLNGMYNSIASVQSPVGKPRWPGYVNYVDPELTRSEAHLVYYGGQLARLKTLKQRFDPRQRFWNPQSIDLPSTTIAGN